MHAITGAELAPRAVGERRRARPATIDVDEHASVRVEVPDLCPRFTARAFADVTIGPSPLWLKARLIAAGQRPINNVVDITNYVMLLTGQPLHAFDLDRVPGGEIIVRAAADGERMTTLDDVERELDSESVLVCDRERPTGHRRDHGRAGLGGLRRRPRASCSRPRTGTARTSSAPRTCCPCARRPRPGSRSSSTPT